MHILQTIKILCKWYLWNISLDWLRIRYRKKIGFVLLMGKEFPPVHIMRTLAETELPGNTVGTTLPFIMFTRRKGNLIRYLDGLYPRWRMTTLHIGLRVLPLGVRYLDKELKKYVFKNG